MATITQEIADVVNQRVAFFAFLYYPEVHINEPDYSLTDDVAFCLEPLTELTASQRDELRHLIAQAIIDPTAYREAVFAAVTDLSMSDTADS